MSSFARVLAVFFLLSPFIPTPLASHVFAEQMPQLVKQNGRYAFLVDGKPYLILGAQINNSSAWPDVLPEVWPAIAAMHANTVEASVYWEQMEPRPNTFDFTNVDALVNQARLHQVHLVLLWFGTWKNGRMHYAPDWVKTDPAHYPRMTNERGAPVDVLSPNAPANLEADRQAYTALMRHLKEIDGSQHTVIMMQVENESGSIGAIRDFSPMAQKQFEGAVPVRLVETLHKQPGNWKQVFGTEADESFAAYSVAHYIDQIAEAGKAIFPLPVYCNVWQGSTNPGIDYPSGGAVIHMLDLWKATVQHIDIIGPDIYTDNPVSYRQTLSAYHRPDNAMWIPETGSSDAFAPFFFDALGQGAIGFSPFGVDDTGWTFSGDEYPKMHGENYALIGPMDGEIAAWNFAGKLKTAVEQAAEASTSLDFGRWQAVVSYGFPQYGDRKLEGTSKDGGRVLIVQLGENEFLVTGFSARVQFHLAGSSPNTYVQLLRAEEGTYQNGSWKTTRLLNGDQTDYGLNFKRDQKAVVRVTLGTF